MSLTSALKGQHVIGDVRAASNVIGKGHGGTDVMDDVVVFMRRRISRSLIWKPASFFRLPLEAGILKAGVK